MIILALILTILGTWFLNSNGSYTHKLPKLVLGWSLNIASLLCFMSEYDSSKGTFIFLALWALVGMAIAFLYPLISATKPS